MSSANNFFFWEPETTRESKKKPLSRRRGPDLGVMTGNNVVVLLTRVTATPRFGLQSPEIYIDVSARVLRSVGRPLWRTYIARVVGVAHLSRYTGRDELRLARMEFGV